jgi:hypothetical protein
LLAAVILFKMTEEQLKIMKRFKRKKNRDTPINIGVGDRILAQYIRLEMVYGYLEGYTERSQLSTNFYLSKKGKEFIESI